MVQTDGTLQRSITRWFVFIDNGAPRVEKDRRRLAGDAWYTNHGVGSSTRAPIWPRATCRGSSTGKLVPLRDTWRPTVRFSGAEGCRMLAISCDPRPEDAKNCGVLVVPFLVRNDKAASGGHGHGGHGAPTATVEARPGLTAPQADVTASAGELVVTLPVRYRNGVAVVAGTVGCDARSGERRLPVIRAGVADGVASCTWRVRAEQRAVVGAIAVRASTVSVTRAFAATL